VNWPLVSIGEFCATGSGGTPSRKNPEYYGGNIPWVKSGDLRENVVREVTEHISELGLQNSSAKVVSQGVILLAMYGATVGRMAILGIDAATNQAVCSIRPDDKRAFSKYVYYALLDKVPEFLKSAVGGAQPNISQGKIRDTKISLPPLEEQKRIAAILDKADAIRRKRQQAIELADQFLRSVFLDMFGDPVTNPKALSIVKIDTLCTEIVDCVNRTAPSVDYETPYKMIRTTNVRDMKIDLSSVRYVEEDTYNSWIRRLQPRIGDLIFTREAPAGEAGIVQTDDKIFLGQRTMHFRPDFEKATPEFILYELMGSSIKLQINRQSAGSTVAHLSVPECKKFLIRSPDLRLQKKFSKIAKQVEKERDSILKANIEMQNLFFSLSQQAFRGELSQTKAV
jgi:type I restriction enzyme, S subunit